MNEGCTNLLEEIENIAKQNPSKILNSFLHGSFSDLSIRLEQEFPSH